MVEAACDRCGREWDYTGRSDEYCTCPNCKTSVKLEASASERAEPSETAERRPDPSERDADAVAALEASVGELYELTEQQAETLGDLVQDGERRADNLDELEAEHAERLDDLRDGLEEVAALFQEFVEANGGVFEYQHISLDDEVQAAAGEVDVEAALSEVEA